MSTKKANVAQLSPTWLSGGQLLPTIGFCCCLIVCFLRHHFWSLDYILHCSGMIKIPDFISSFSNWTFVSILMVRKIFLGYFLLACIVVHAYTYFFRTIFLKSILNILGMQIYPPPPSVRISGNRVQETRLSK